jgi:PAS domain S-box-containing protein
MPPTPSDFGLDPRLVGLDDGTDPFVAAVRATRMPMVITDPRQLDNPIVFVNDAFCTLTGYERSEIVGRNCRFLQGPQTDADAVQRVREAVRAEETIQLDLCNHRKDGTTFWNRLLLGPVRGKDGDVAYFFGSQMDVTAERDRLAGLEQTNTALASRLEAHERTIEMGEARLLAAADAGDLGIWQLDLIELELVASKHFKTNFGRDPTLPFTYAQLLEAVHADDQARMQAAVQRTIATGEDYRIEYRVARPDGQPGWVRTQARLEKDAQGRPAFLAGISQDITSTVLDRKRTELLDHLDRHVYGVLDDASEIAYRAAEALGRALDVSRAGYGTVDTMAETIAIARDWNAPGIQSLAGVLHFRDYGSYIEDLKRGDTVVFADAFVDPRTRENADALLAISAQAVVNMPVSEAGGIVALLYLNHATARQWTQQEMALVREVALRTRQAVERRRAEQQLRGLAESLERQVRERTQELMRSEAALRQSQKMEAVGQLTGGLAHDFNNLLGAISGSLEMLQRRAKGDASLARYVDMGQAATKRAAALTHRLLAFSRQQTLEPRVLQVNYLIEAFEDLVRRTIGPQVTLEVGAADGLWRVLADPGQLESALLNLCINARDAMPNGGRLSIETANRTIDDRSAQGLQLTPGQYVTICVIDDGVGMPDDVVEHAFEPFFTTKPIGAGSGLGLSMVYGFARQSGGHVRIQSEAGSGTTVCMYLPRHDGDLPAPGADGVTAGVSLDGGTGRTILVVDDEHAVRMLMAEVLREMGHNVLEAADGPDAVRQLQADQGISFLVTDVGLPGGMNGRQVAEAARRILPSIKVLFVTGYADHAALSHVHLLNGMHVLTKPFELNAFCQMVQNMMEAKGP